MSHASVAVFISFLGMFAAVVGCSASSPRNGSLPAASSSSGTQHAVATSVDAGAASDDAVDAADSAPAAPAEVYEPPPMRPLPPGFVAVFDPFDERWKPQVACGDFHIANVKPPDMTTSYEPFVVVTDKSGKKVYEAHGRRHTDEGMDYRDALVADICGDLTGDGIPEIILTERSMGAHCCYTHYVVSMTRPPSRILMWEKGDSGDGIFPIKLGKGRSYQLMSYDRIFPPFNGAAGEPAVSYAWVPAYPIIFELVGSEYKARTFLFGDALREMREKNRAECKGQSGCEPSELYEWGIGLIVGDWDQQKASIVPDEETRKAFDRRSGEMRAIMRKRLGP